MRPTRFCLTLFGGTLAFAAIVAAFNILVDPYLLFDRPRLAGFNAVKSSVWGRERLIKIYAAPRSAPRTVILGSSRTDLGFDPSHSIWRPDDRPVYNLSIAGADTKAMVRSLQHLIAVNAPDHVPRTVIAGLEFERFLIRPATAGTQEGPQPSLIDQQEFEERLAVRESGDPNPARGWRMLKDYLAAMFSLDAFADSLATVAASRTLDEISIEPDGRITEAVVRKDLLRSGVAAVFAKKDVEALRTYMLPRHYLSEFPGGPIPLLADVRKLIDICKANGIAMKFFIHPAHADRLELLDRLGYWDDYERWKRALTDLVAAERRQGADVALWDFGGYESIGQERLPPAKDRTSRLRWFWDPVHYTTEVGDLIVARMLYQPTSGSYGVELTPATVDQRLAEIRRDRESYRQREPMEALRRAALFCSAGSDCGRVIAP